MSYILNIHTATETAIINLVKNGEVLGTVSNDDAKQHATILHTAIRQLLNTNDLDIKELNAVGVSSGPGLLHRNACRACQCKRAVLCVKHSAYYF